PSRDAPGISLARRDHRRGRDIGMDRGPVSRRGQKQKRHHQTDRGRSHSLRCPHSLQDRIAARWVFGRAHISVDLGANEDLPELMKSIADPKGNILPAKVGTDKLEGFRNVEPVWAWPQQYNSLDPLSPDWYRPRTWLVMSKEVSSSR